MTTSTPTSVLDPRAGGHTGHTGHTERTERSDPHCLAVEELARAAGALPHGRFLAMGDSIAAGLGDPVPGYEDRTWAQRLAAALAADGRPLAHRNLGEPFLRAAEIRARQLDAAVAFAPDLVVVTAGGNDALSRRFEPDEVGVHLAAMVAALQARGATVVTFGVFDLSTTGLVPPEARPGLHRRITALNDTTRRVSARHGAVHVDFSTHPAFDAAIVSADRVHPNRRGHAVIATEVVRALAGERREEDARLTNAGWHGGRAGEHDDHRTRGSRP